MKEVRHGDCLDLMAAMEPASVDAIVTDPPYGLAFMGKGWDHGVPGAPFWVEALRVAKPGAHLLAFGGTRTYHRLACAIEDAGWEIRDCLMWLYGSGFPKSLDVSKALDKAAGAEREVIGPDPYASNHPNPRGAATPARPVTAPAIDLAKQWAGWGTALKPAWEPIILARKPLAGTVAANVQAHGTGALNVDACRIEAEGGSPAAARRQGKPSGRPGEYEDGRIVSRVTPERYAQPRVGEAAGRWPANVVLDEDAAALLDAQSGERPSNDCERGSGFQDSNLYGKGIGSIRAPGYGDTGGASRFFYCAKASRAEREAGLEHRDEKPLLWSAGTQNPGSFQSPNTHRAARNHHPTVKPVALMRWLCRLVTPAGGLILDPFAGSGTTGVACALEGFRFLGMEREAEYIEIALARITQAREQPSLFDLDGAA